MYCLMMMRICSIFKVWFLVKIAAEEKVKKFKPNDLESRPHLENKPFKAKNEPVSKKSNGKRLTAEHQSFKDRRNCVFKF